MPGDRLVNGAGVSRRRRGQSTVSSPQAADTDGRSESSSRRPFVGPFDEETAATAGSEYMMTVQRNWLRRLLRRMTGSIPVRSSPANTLRRRQYMTDCRLEYMI